MCTEQPRVLEGYTGLETIPLVERQLRLPIDLLCELQSHYFPGHWDNGYDPSDPDSWPHFRVMATDEFEAALIASIQPGHLHLHLEFRDSSLVTEPIEM